MCRDHYKSILCRMEMGQITPPVGINVFVIHGVADGVSMGTVFKGVLPFLLVQVLVIVTLTFFRISHSTCPTPWMS